MSPPLTPTRHGALTTRSVWWFFAATFGVTWGLGVLTLVVVDQFESTFGRGLVAPQDGRVPTPDPEQDQVIARRRVRP